MKGAQSRKSTSGGVTLFGSHCLKTWSVSQQVIALSSGEAEYYGLVKGASVSLGLKGMLDDIDLHNCGIVICTDAAAAKGIASRRGLGKVRHIELCELWLQEQGARGRISITGSDNFSDSLTKIAPADRICQTLHCTSHACREGRHPIMPRVAQ